MATELVQDTGRRAQLSREQIIGAALRYIDKNGLEQLSMHKLGAELGVKGMSLYNHVANKDDLLDGVVEMLWSEMENATTLETGDWRESVRSFAHAQRDVIHRHANAAPLMMSQQIMPFPALRLVLRQVTAAQQGGVSEADAYAILRIITSYAFGSALTEVDWGQGIAGCGPAVSDLLRPGVPDELAAVAEIFCGQSNPASSFELGLNLMLRGADLTQPNGLDETHR